MKISRNVLVLIVILRTFARPALAQTCVSPAPTAAEEQKAIVIDALNGSVAGIRQYRVGAETRVILKNKNPFRYSYVLKIEESAIVEDAIGKFLAFAKISTTDAPEKKPDPAAPATGTQAPAAPTPECTEAIALFETRHKALDKASTELKTAVEDEIKNYEKLTADVKTKLLDPLADGPRLCMQVGDALKLIDDFKPSTAPAEKLKALQALIDAQETALNNPPQPCKIDRKKYRNGIDNAEKIAKWAEGKIDEFSAEQKKIDQLAKDVKDTIRNPNAFWEARPLGPHNERTEAKISVTKTDKTIADAKAESVRPEFKVNFGAGRRFFMAGGIAASSADLTRYKTIDGFVLDRDGKQVKNTDGSPKFGKVVGLEEDSVGRVSPAILLHGIFARPKGVGLGLALGVGSAGSDSSVIEFFAGPTVSLIDDHLFITLGAFRGEETHLAGDFYVGAEVPTTATLSTFKSKTWTFGLGLTFRIP
jgi:hypothetical protein